MTNRWDLRCRIYRLEVDAETLKRDPVGNRAELAILHAEIETCRRALGKDRGLIYPVAVELCFNEKTVRVIADSPDDAGMVERAWLRAHPGGGVMRQRAEYSAWAMPLLSSSVERKAS